MTPVWPSPQGLNYDLGIPAQLSPDWYLTGQTCPNGDASCQGKYAYISGNPNGSQYDGPGYVATMFAAFQTSRAKYANSTLNYNPQVVANAHSGPPDLTDLTYADQEAPIFLGISLPPGDCVGYCDNSGFGQESLSEYDVYSQQAGRPCEDDWCALFTKYSPTYTANYYLQTTIPNLKAAYPIASITTGTSGQYQQGLVTCASTCTNYNSNPPAFSPGGLYNEEGFAYTINGKTSSYKIANNGTDKNHNPVGIINATQFTCDTNTPCALGTNLTLYTGDYIPDTIPFAGKNYADTIEVYFCDWEFALNQNSSLNNTGCQSYDTTYSLKYATILSPPL